MLPERYHVQNISKVVRNPELILREIYRWMNIPIQPLHNYHFNYKHKAGVDVMSKDWDNLIILDACRYDFFKEQNTIAGELQPVLSKGARSWEYMQNNFTGRNLHDTIYVTANPYVGNLDSSIFYTVDPLLDQWHEKPGTVHPEVVLDAALELQEEHPNKRMIVHFMQPHLPYLGETAERCYKRVNIRGYQPFNHSPDGERESSEQSGISWWAAVRRGYISRNETRQAYSETLDIVLKYVQKLIEQINGKSVISADHGEMLGERIAPLTHRRYGHPKGLHTEKLRIVPWLEISYDERRDVQSETPVGFKRLDKSIVDERLRALGYM